MIKRLLKFAAVAALLGMAVFWWLSAPVSESELHASTLGNDTPTPDLANGELVFWASGCASCHSATDAKGDEKLRLGGGHELKTPFGTFITPNISPDVATGIGSWDFYQFADAMIYGQSPEGKHYYPSFPFSSYARMKTQDVADLWAFLKTLPAVSQANQAHDLPLPFQWRRSLGIWKVLFSDNEPIMTFDDEDEILSRGQYLVEGMGHCGECHTPRNILGGPDNNRWLAGGPAPEGDGNIPNITPHEDGIGAWSEDDIVYYLESGFTPEFDSAGGSMTDVVDNMAKLPKIELQAIAKYLKSVPPVASQ